MFKKFKDKLAEEMKQSPARLQASMQQFAQAVVSPALSNSSIQELSASNDNFSLTEEGDETPKNSPAKHGFQNVDLISPSPNSMGISRRSSVSSVTSDTSSLFPIYESPGNLYHLQSDMDQSASEVEENISPQLDKITKDQLYSAYRKVQTKYHKYRGRYTDLATHYRELERVKGKLESVLVETQDKVLRRIADLKEQCQLEQQAKAHLEEALRNDIEEKDHIINTLNTKIKLLQTSEPSLESAISEISDQTQSSKDNLIDLSTESSSNSDDTTLVTENAQLKDKLKKLENLVFKCRVSLKRNKVQFQEIITDKEKLESEYEMFKTTNADKLKTLEGEIIAARLEISNLNEQVNTLNRREEESVISLAENKLSVHRELEEKEEQIKQLQLDLKQMTESKDSLSITIERYKTELEKLQLLQNASNMDSEKKEIIEDISRGKSEALKLMQQEMQQKLITLEANMGSKYHKEVDRNKELLKRLEELEKENELEKFVKSDDSKILNNLKSALNEKEIELREIKSKLEDLQKLSEGYRCDRDKLHTELSNCKLKYKELESEREAQKIIDEERKKEAEMTVEKLQATVQSLDKELENMRGALMDRDKVCANFNTKVQEYASMLEKAKENLVTQDAEVRALKERVQDDTKINKLQEELDNKDTEILGLHSELKSCRATISDLKDKLQTDNCTIDLLHKQKKNLIVNILNYKNSIQKLKEDSMYIRGSVKEHLSEQTNKMFNLNRTLVTSLIHLQKNSNTTNDEVQNLPVKLKEYEELAQKHGTLEMELANAVHLKSILESDLQKCKEELKEMSTKLEKRNELESRNRKLIAEVDSLNFKLYDLEKLPEELKALKEESNCLKEKLSSAMCMNQTLSNEISDLKAQLEEVNNISGELDSLRKMYTESTETVKLLKSECSNSDVLRQETESLKSEIKRAKENLIEKDNQIENLREELQREESHVTNLKAECNNQARLVEGHIEVIRKLEKDNETATKEYEKRVNEVSEFAKSQVDKLTSAIGKKVEQVRNLKAVKEQQDKAILEFTAKLDDVERKNAELVALLRVSEQEKDALNSENSEISVLKDRNSALVSEVQQLKSIRDEINLENKDLKDKQNDLIKRNQELQESTDSLHQKVVECENTYQKLLNDNSQLRNTLAECEDKLLKERNELQSANITLRELDNALQTRNEELQSHVEKLSLCEKKAREVQETLTKENQQLCDELSELRSTLRDSRSTEEKNKELLKVLETKQMELKALEQEISKLRLRLDDLNAVQSQNNELLAEGTSLKSRILELENTIEHTSWVNAQHQLDVESKNAELTTELNTLKGVANSQNTELKSQITNLNVDNERLTKELDELKLAVDEKAAELKLLDTRNSDLLREVERLKGSSSISEDRMEETEIMKNTISDFEEKIGKLTLEIETLSETNITLQKELQNAQESNTVRESLIKEKNTLKEQKNKLEAQLDEALITFQAKELQMQIVNDELKIQADKMKEQLKTNEEEQSMRLKQLVKEFQAQLHDKEEELQAALEKRFDRQQNYESSLIQQYKEQLKDFQVELTAKSEQIETLILENKELRSQKTEDVNDLAEKIALIQKEHTDEIREIERKWKVILQQRTDQLDAKHEEEISELTKEWQNERRPDTKTATSAEELESTSRVAMAAVQSNTGSFHTLQQTLTSQRRELTELRKLVKLRHDTLEDSTEIEYLRNILFEYMMGRETVVLARVIAAVVKFDQEQTAKVLKKEEDKMTLLGSLGLS